MKMSAQVAQTILSNMGITDIKVERVRELTDHYDPSVKTVRLQGIYNFDSLAAAVAAHECAHVLQDKKDYKFMNRAALVPAAILGSRFAPMLVMGGIFSSALGSISIAFIYIGIALFLGAIAFHVITLLKFDASRRALKLVDELNIL